MPENADRIERAAGYLGELVEETRQLTEKTAGLQVEVRMDRYERRRAKRWAIYAATLFALMVALMVTIATMNRLTLTEMQKNNRVIEDCTTAGGWCFEETQRREAEQVKQIARDNARTNVQIVACAKERTVAQFRVCVQENIADVFPPSDPPPSPR